MVEVGDLKRNLESYFQSLEFSKVRTLEELVQFNNKHSKEELPEGKSELPV
jgi:hypothetical protein